MAKTLPSPCVSTAVMAETLPSPCVSAAVLAKTLHLPCASAACMAKTLPFALRTFSIISYLVALKIGFVASSEGDVTPPSPVYLCPSSLPPACSCCPLSIHLSPPACSALYSAPSEGEVIHEPLTARMLSLLLPLVLCVGLGREKVDR